jgi:siroheme synthase (precorrin-2 oxidase/ferrochelatase)
MNAFTGKRVAVIGAGAAASRRRTRSPGAAHK